MENNQKTYPIWMYKPKYDELYVAQTEADEKEILDEQGGCFVYFDHSPSDDEQTKANWDFYMPNYGLDDFDTLKQQAIEEEMDEYYKEEKEQELSENVQNVQTENFLKNSNKKKF